MVGLSIATKTILVHCGYFVIGFDLFFGFEYDYSIGTAVFGAKKHSQFVKALLNQYCSIDQAVINNGIVTQFFIENLDSFRLNGKRQSVVYRCGNKAEQVEIYDKSEFHRGKVFGYSHAIHLCEYSWGEGYNCQVKPWKKFVLVRVPFFNYVAYQFHKQARCLLEQGGELQQIYKDTIRREI